MKNKLLLLILILAFVLRVVNLSQRFPLSGEVGDNLLDIKQIYETQTIPLTGPPTSHPWLYFGPLYYYLLYPIWWATVFSPFSVAYLGVITSLITIILNFYLVKVIIDKKTAIISSSLISLSPLWIDFSLGSRFYFIITLLFYPLIYNLFKIWKGNRNNIYFLAIFLGLISNFHYSGVLFFIPVILILWIKKSIFKASDILYSILIIIAVNLPLIIFDYQHKTNMITNLLLWFPYRLLGFAGIIPKNNLDFELTTTSIQSVIEALGRTFTHQVVFYPLIAILFFGLLLFFKRTIRDKFRYLYLFLFPLLIANIMAVIIHQDAPIHYLMPIFPAIVIITSILISRLNLKYILILLFLFISINFSYYKNIFNTSSENTGFIPADTQIKLSEEIIKDSRGKEFSLQRVGPFDYFEENYSQNYKYLLWYMGNEPVDNSNLVYIIYEGENYDFKGKVIYGYENIFISKLEL